MVSLFGSQYCMRMHTVIGVHQANRFLLVLFILLLAATHTEWFLVHFENGISPKNQVN